MTDTTSPVTPAIAPAISRRITRRPLAYWAALAVVLIFASSTFALWTATYLADLL
ncbi:MAG TPA: hypothetical protein VGH43_12235 [Jatrophihabitans sp.]